MSTARPFHLPGERALSWVRRRASVALTAWAREWVNSAVNEEQLVTLRVEPVHADDLCPELEELSGANGSLWIRRRPRDRQKLGEAVVGAELMPQSVYADDWVEAIADDAWAARNRALCEALLGVAKGAKTKQAAPLVRCASAGSGAVTIGFEPWGLFAIADSGIWNAMPPPETRVAAQSPLVPLDRAAVSAPLQIDVMLGGAELELPQLLNLQPGDVLRLRTRLDEPVHVSCDGRPFARAALGHSAGRKAIQIGGG